jgi:hypothetical protein
VIPTSFFAGYGFFSSFNFRKSYSFFIQSRLYLESSFQPPVSPAMAVVMTSDNA